MPEYKVYWLTSSSVGPKGAKEPVTTEYILEGIKYTGANGVDCHYKRGVVTKEMVKAIHDAGYEFHVWTVDKLADAQEAFRCGVDTVTTNCAKKLYDGDRAGK